jgi:hypothetical protein
MIYIIGDSNTRYLTIDKDIIYGLVDRGKLTQDVFPMSIDNEDITLLYYSGMSAYKISHDYLTEMSKDVVITSKTPIVFQFGAIDIRAFLSKYDNTKDVVKNYVKKCMLFCEQYGLKPIFIQPFTCIEHMKYNLEFEEALRLECQRLDLYPPIEIFGSIVGRQYPSEPVDEVCHLSIEDNARLLRLILEHISKQEKIGG